MTIPVRCDCGHQFEAASGLAGGLTNCPRCGRATEVPGLRDPLWRLWQALGVVAVVGAAALGLRFFGPAAAIGCGLAGVALLWLISRAF